MKCCASKKRYSLGTLRPTSKEERKLFWEFRVDDIIEMFDFKIICDVLLLLAFLLNYSSDDKTEDMLYRLGRRLINLLFYFIVWLIAKRFKRSFIYWIPVVHFFTRFTAMLAA